MPLTLEPAAPKPVYRGMKTERSSLAQNRRGLMPCGLRTSLREPVSNELAQAGEYGGFAIKVLDEQGNEVAYVPIGKRSS